MGGRSSATGGGSSLRFSAVGDLACTCEHKRIMANTEGG